MSTEEKLTPAAWRRPSIIDRAQWSYSTHEPAAWSEREALYDEATVRRLSAEVQELREALRPFAEAGGQVPTGHGPDNEPVSDDEPVTMSVVGFLVGDVTAADLARARAALKPETVNG